jgi:hypothetical protein
MAGLSAKAKQHIETLFDGPDRAAAAEALLRWSEDGERLRFAALRVSGGDLRKLHRAIEMPDWRDLLVAAGFAEDVRAHESWTPRLLEPEVLQAWTNGGHLDGVYFGPGEQVMARSPFVTIGRVAVLSLDGLEPEPRYTVVGADGKRHSMWQWPLSAAG